jgi:hypothetical protein
VQCNAQRKGGKLITEEIRLVFVYLLKVSKSRKRTECVFADEARKEGAIWVRSGQVSVEHCSEQRLEIYAY